MSHLSNPTGGSLSNGTQKVTHASYVSHLDLSFDTYQTSATVSLANPLNFPFQIRQFAAGCEMHPRVLLRVRCRQKNNNKNNVPRQAYYF